MDEFFVQRGSGDQGPIVATTVGAQEIVVDEQAPGEFLSIDERRLRSSAGRQDHDSKDAADAEPSGLHHDPKRYPDSPPSAPFLARDGPPTMLDELFSRPRGKESAGQPVSDKTRGNSVDALFSKPATSPTDGIDALFCARGKDVTRGCDIDDESNNSVKQGLRHSELGGGVGSLTLIGDDLEAAATSAAVSGRDVGSSYRRVGCRCCCIGICDGRCCSCLGNGISCISCELSLLWQVLPTLIVLILVAAVTVSLATSCSDISPLGRVCVGGGWVQWVVATAPAVAALLCILVWCRRTFVRKNKLKAAAWQHDAEAQNRAVAVLDALVVEAAGERVKYAQQTVRIMSDFPDKAIIQHKGCVAIEAMCRAARGNSTQVKAAGAVPVLLKAMERHRKVRTVQRSALAALGCLAKVAKSQIYDLGGSFITLQAMMKFKRDPAVQVSGAMTLGALCLNSAANRRSVARYGGVSVLLQALDRHLGRADVLIAASETLVLLAQGDAVLRKQMLASLPAVQGLIGRFEGVAAAANEAKRRDSEIVLRSLRKLEGQLTDSAIPGEDDDNHSESEIPHLEAIEGMQVLQANVGQALELQNRYDKWKEKMPKKKAGGR
eukprot:TRINITY_DN68182_c0_g1_i1.p1 TRINITY_DN68182_c0_g1~~TRINITY_DN68182_c0_g1_i1.p1  ORF type:complete len:608 (-),score=104.48 TRINITY_DN68182_c0_g1_i1:93-1916(-)